MNMKDVMVLNEIIDQVAARPPSQFSEDDFYQVNVSGWKGSRRYNKENKRQTVLKCPVVSKTGCGGLAGAIHY